MDQNDLILLEYFFLMNHFFVMLINLLISLQYYFYGISFYFYLESIQSNISMFKNLTVKITYFV